MKAIYKVLHVVLIVFVLGSIILVSCNPDAEILAAPKNLTDSQETSFDTIQVSRDAVDDAVSYVVSRYDSADGTFTLISSITGTELINDGDGPGSYPLLLSPTYWTDYYYRVLLQMEREITVIHPQCMDIYQQQHLTLMNNVI